MREETRYVDVSSFVFFVFFLHVIEVSYTIELPIFILHVIRMLRAIETDKWPSKLSQAVTRLELNAGSMIVIKLIVPTSYQARRHIASGFLFSYSLHRQR